MKLTAIQTLITVNFHSQQQKKWQDMLSYCRVVASSAFIIKKKLHDSPFLTITLHKRYTAFHRSHGIQISY